ncbi:conserved hypothetical protein [Frankia canadensis]|uniref:DUF4097 domain-containing protein n=1 Tax=Frankia canadensis TaxID=1836972 RepID=A0A2I2L2P9_9ACTN|nr:DUF4097 family beta strand repeat-containing protein [Frankia canadensis]SNQ52203.1 conserved hypothetical protein [Frankia canadensis]SOU59493.1 conserved hypothetical protein [Frankia canadensis]
MSDSLPPGSLAPGPTPSDAGARGAVAVDLPPGLPPVGPPPRRGRVLALAAGGVCALGLTVFAGLGVIDGTTGREHVVQHREFAASVTHVVVRAPSGDVHLHTRDPDMEPPGSAAGAGVSMVARLSGLVDQPRLDTRVDGDTVRIAADCHQVWDCSVDYDLTLPPGASADVRVSSGDLIADDLTGDAVLATSSGDVLVHRPGGRLDASTGSGDISVGDARSRRLRASTSSGDVRIHQLVPPDDLDAHTSSGDVRVTLPRGNELYATDASTDSGRREVEIRQDPAASRRIRATTSSGDVVITYRDDS